MGLRGKLLLSLLLVVAAVFGTAGWLTILQIENQLVTNVRSKAQALLSSMAQPCAIAMANGEFEVVDGYIGQVIASRWAKELDVQQLMLLDHKGRIYAHSDPTRFGHRPADPFYQNAMRAAGMTLRKVHRPLQAPLLEAAIPVASGLRWGTLVARFSLDKESELLRQASWRVLLWALGLAAAAGLLLTMVLYVSVLSPVRRLTEVTKAFSRGKFEKRVGLHGRDELSKLGEHFDGMADQLVELKKKLPEAEEQLDESADKGAST
ncbi:MAG: HAMP domain-containing protein [Deltaproteobacteria bacterium]|nr:HAMP domain-containing protein [Deltaproteobacteria bacterium]